MSGTQIQFRGIGLYLAEDDDNSKLYEETYIYYISPNMSMKRNRNETLFGLKRIEDHIEKLQEDIPLILVYDGSDSKKEESLITLLTKSPIAKMQLRHLLVYGVETDYLSENIKKLVTTITIIPRPEDPFESLKNGLQNILEERSKLDTRLQNLLTSTIQKNEDQIDPIINSTLKNNSPKLLALDTQPTFQKDKPLQSDVEFNTLKKNFYDLLSDLKNKAQLLNDQGHTLAATYATEVTDLLSKSAETYFAAPTQKAYDEFRTETKKILKKGHEELDKHRGWKCVLGNIALAILGLGVFYLIAVAINRNIFFNKTTSAEKLDSLETSIEEIGKNNPMIQSVNLI